MKALDLDGNLVSEEKEYGGLTDLEILYRKALNVEINGEGGVVVPSEIEEWIIGNA